ncbi:Uncharacterized protein FWK35_00026830, partial [Aphis craccivora]
MFCNETVDFTMPNNIGQVMGSFNNGKKCHTIHEFYPNVPSGYKIIEVPTHLLLDLRGEPISIRTTYVKPVSRVNNTYKATTLKKNSKQRQLRHCLTAKNLAFLRSLFKNIYLIKLCYLTCSKRICYVLNSFLIVQLQPTYSTQQRRPSEIKFRIQMNNEIFFL